MISSSISERGQVKEQYKTSANLNTRISIHAKYSVNRQGFGNWIFEQYRLCENGRILELGCGNGSMWTDHALPAGAELILTDFSEGMLDSARENVGKREKISFRQADIQQIPYADEAFDTVIANMMLYHVPDLDRALSEVRRVLKPGGIFYCATTGTNGIAEYVRGLLEENGVRCGEGSALSFTLQNGGELLRKYFPAVEMRRYEDHLEVAETGDLVDYILSLEGMADFRSVTPEEMYRILDGQKKNGVIRVPKEYGMFVSEKMR